MKDYKLSEIKAICEKHSHNCHCPFRYYDSYIRDYLCMFFSEPIGWPPIEAKDCEVNDVSESVERDEDNF